MSEAIRTGNSNEGVLRQSKMDISGYLTINADNIVTTQ
jgi:hypothetical protein